MSNAAKAFREDRYLGGGSDSMLECLPSAFNSHTEYTCTHRHRQAHIHGGGGVEGWRGRGGYGQTQRESYILHSELRNSTHTSCLPFPSWLGVSADPDLSLHTVV